MMNNSDPSDHIILIFPCYISAFSVVICKEFLSLATTAQSYHVVNILVSFLPLSIVIYVQATYTYIVILKCCSIDRANPVKVSDNTI